MEHSYTIDKIEWERVLLKIHVSCDNNADFFFAGKNKERYRIDSERSGDGYILKINISCVHNRHFLDNGRWHIIARMGDTETRCQVQNKLAYRLEDKARIFRYAEEQMAYTVSFGCELIGSDRLILYIDSYFMKENTKWKKRKYVKETRLYKDKGKRFFMSIAVSMIKIWYSFLSFLLPKNGKRILIMSETHNYLWGNLKALDKEIKKRGMDKEYKIDYSFRNNVGKHQSVFDAFSWLKVTTKIARQDFIFIDDYAPVIGFIRPDRRTKIIQVWHAGLGFKAVGYARFGMKGSPFPEESAHKKYSKAIVASDSLKGVYSEVFGISCKDCLPLGMPRLDDFLNKDIIEQSRISFYKEYPELKDRKIVLFAPTFRGSEQKDAYYNYKWLNLKKIYDWCVEKNATWIFKMHPFINDNITIPKEFSDRLYQLKSEIDINELFYVTDILVTDYSSTYYEFVLTEGACLFYTPDREIYELTHGVHRSVKDCAPGKVCDTFDELLNALYEENCEIEKTNNFVKKIINEKTGSSSGRIIDEIILGEKHE